ncbi:MAG: peptidylprolyl isomerase [Halocynthiibacter sp.]
MKALFPDVVVNGDVISAADIAAEAQNHNAPADKPGWAYQAAARALTVRALLLQKANELGLTAVPKEIAEGKFETTEEALIREVIESQIESNSVSSTDMRSYYDRAQDNFRAPSLYEPAHILFAIDPRLEDGREEALTRAKAAVETLRQAPEKFGQLASEMSDCPSRDNRGLLGQLSDGDTVPAFEQAMAAMNAGEMSDLVETEYGFHIIRLNAKAVGDVLPFEEVETQIKEQFEKRGWAEASFAYIQSLVDAAEITGVNMQPKAA